MKPHHVKFLGLGLAALLVATACAGPGPAARRAEAMLSAGDVRGAEEAIDAGLRQRPDDEHLLRLRVRVFATRGDNARAVAAWQDITTRRGKPDRRALRQLALLTVWNGLRADDAGARELAIRAAWDLDEERLAEGVAERLDDDDEVVRASAAAALLRSHPDAPTVLTDALRSPEPRARAIAVKVLGDKVGAPARADLVAALGDADAGVRVAACAAVGKVGTADDLARLVAATGDADGGVRAAALAALTARKAAEGAAPARTLLADPYLGARLAALGYLDQVGGAAAEDELVRAAAGADTFVALRAGVALARRGKRAQIPAGLFARAAGDGDWTVRAAAANAAVRLLGKDGARAALAPLVADAEPAVRLAAARALLDAGDRAGAVAVFIDVLALPDALLRLQVAVDLQRLGDARAAGAFTSAVTSEDAAVREAAATAPRGRAGAGLIVAPLLADASWKIRVAAAWTILAE